MPLKINNTDITTLFVNGTEQNALHINNTAYFGKRLSLTQGSSTGVSFSISRTSSPNQQASTGSISSGDAIYYGDTVTITAGASGAYFNPELFADIRDGNGEMKRTNPFTFTAANNVTYRGSATYEPWPIVWSGEESFYSSGFFTVSGLSSGDIVQLTAKVVFAHYINNYLSRTYEENIIRGELPSRIDWEGAYARFTNSGDQLYIEAYERYDSNKGTVAQIKPIQIILKEIRRKA